MEKDVDKQEVEEGYELSEDEMKEDEQNVYAEGTEVIDKPEDTEKKEKVPDEVAPDEVSNAVYFPSYVRESQTKRHGEVPPVKFKYKPMVDEQRVKFYEAIAKAKNLSATRKMGHKMLARHIITSSLVIPDEKNKGKFIKMDVGNPLLWKFVDPSVMQDMIDKVIGDIYIPEDTKGN